jgi:Rrf2 family iron-sulfur cluster assembly transcriptional regulator
MRITTRGRYALRASLALARLGRDGEPVSISSLSEQEHISSMFLEQIFFRLRKAGIVSSVRGPGGGFCFAQPLEQLTIRAILEAAGEDLDLSSCNKGNSRCKRLGGACPCTCHGIWTGLSEAVNTFFRSITLASIIEQNLERERLAVKSAPGIP